MAQTDQNDDFKPVWLPLLDIIAGDERPWMPTHVHSKGDCFFCMGWNQGNGAHFWAYLAIHSPPEMTPDQFNHYDKIMHKFRQTELGKGLDYKDHPLIKKYTGQLETLTRLQWCEVMKTTSAQNCYKSLLEDTKDKPPEARKADSPVAPWKCSIERKDLNF